LPVRKRPTDSHGGIHQVPLPFRDACKAHSRKKELIRKFAREKLSGIASIVQTGSYCIKWIIRGKRVPQSTGDTCMIVFKPIRDFVNLAINQYIKVCFQYDFRPPIFVLHYSLGIWYQVWQLYSWQFHLFTSINGFTINFPVSPNSKQAINSGQ